MPFDPILRWALATFLCHAVRAAAIAADRTCFWWNALCLRAVDGDVACGVAEITWPMSRGAVGRSSSSTVHGLVPFRV